MRDWTKLPNKYPIRAFLLGMVAAGFMIAGYPRIGGVFLLAMIGYVWLFS